MNCDEENLVVLVYQCLVNKRQIKKKTQVMHNVTLLMLVVWVRMKYGSEVRRGRAGNRLAVGGASLLLLFALCRLGFSAL